MHIDFDDAWSEIARDRHRVAARELDFERAQRKLGVRFPESFTQLYKRQNGGFLRVPDSVRNRGSESAAEENAWYHTGEELFTLAEIATMAEHSAKGWDVQASGLLELIAISQQGSHFLCLDYRHTADPGDPAVTFIDAECNDEVVMTRTFDDYLSLVLQSVA
jgi:hypothetical protein